MARSPFAALAAIGMLLCFAVGYLLGSDTQIETSELERNQVNILAELEALRDGRAPGRSEASASAAGQWSGNESAPATSSSDGLRLPDLDPWVERIDRAIAALEKTIERTRDSMPVSTPNLVARARDQNLPRHDAQLRRFVKEIEYAENYESEPDAYDKLYEKHQFRSFEAVLDQFGRPDEMDVDAGIISISYIKLVPGKEEEGEELWHAYFDFRDGILVDFGGYSNGEI